MYHWWHFNFLIFNLTDYQFLSIYICLTLLYVYIVQYLPAMHKCYQCTQCIKEGCLIISGCLAWYRHLVIIQQLALILQPMKYLRTCSQLLLMSLNYRYSVSTKYYTACYGKGLIIYHCLYRVILLQCAIVICIYH